LLCGCKLVVTVPLGATVVTQSGSFSCGPGDTCEIDFVDDTFDQTFLVEVDEGHHFAYWLDGERHYCVRQQAPCRLFTTFFGISEALLALLEDETAYYLEPHVVPLLTYDFSPLDERMQSFVEESDFDGASVAVVHKDLGVVHEQAFGRFTLETVVKLASASKLPSASLLMALAGDKKLNFDPGAPIGDYLPWEGHYGAVTTEQLLSNASGIPGIDSVDNYGPHLCQYIAGATFEQCAQQIYGHLLPGTQPPGTIYTYGGSQWQLAGAVAEQAGGKPWAALFQKYLARPCGLTVFEYGNMLAPPTDSLWTGDPAGLTGLENPNIEAGAISNLRDYEKLLAMHLNDGWCGSRRVLQPGVAEWMREDRKLPDVPGGEVSGAGYAMGWWIRGISPDGFQDIFWDPGGNGQHVWLDDRYDYGVVLLVDDLSGADGNEAAGLVHEELLALVREIMTSRQADLPSITETFDADPQWFSFNLPGQNNDFGFRIPGQAGGYFSAEDILAWYGDDQIGIAQADEAVQARGTLSIRNLEEGYNNNVFIGHFNSGDSAEINGLGLQILEGSNPDRLIDPNSFRVFYKIGNTEGYLFEIPNTPETLDWHYFYDPGAGSNGSLTITVGKQTADVALSAAQRGSLATLRAFGMAVEPSGYRPERVELYIDDVTYSVW
jgi:CubicO group peptidase (beta-lactamase class C family)